MSRNKENIIDLKISEEIGKIDEIINGYKYYSVLSTALETKIFEWLYENGPADKETITKSLNYNGMFTRCFLATLEDMELVSENEGLYSNTDLSNQFLLSKSTFYQGDLILSLKDDSSKWKNLSENIKEQKERIAGFEEGPSERHLNNIAQRGIRGEFQAVAARISEWDGFKDARELLDIGGGHGLYSISLCQKNPDLNAVVFDKPHVTGLTSKYIKSYDMEDRVSAVAGDMTIEITGKDYDIVLMSHLLYKFRNELPDILKKVSESIKTGGLLVLNHWFCSPGCIPETGCAINDLEKSLISFGHPLCHTDLFEDFLKETGFEIIGTDRIPTAYGDSTLYLSVFTGSTIQPEKDAEEMCCKCKMS